MRIVRELPAGQTHRCYRAMLELRPDIGTVEEFVERVDRAQRSQGYRLIASFERRDDGGGGGAEDDAAAVAGFRAGYFLGWGYALYCDGLATRPDRRGRGHAGELIEWLIAEAARLGCRQVHLDSGARNSRQDARRREVDQRMLLSSEHAAR